MILSYTRGADDEEVTFRGLVENAGKRQVGYRKLTFHGNQAAKNGFQNFWVDTGCIVKLSSTGLSETINSMFHWYYNAAICYVYLSEVLTGGST
jgi:hypothetical protein